MAETPVERLRRELRELEDKRLRNEIGDVQYFAELDVLRKLLQEGQQDQVKLPYEPADKLREYYFDVEEALEGKGLARKYASRFEKMGMDPDQAFAKGKEKVSKDTRKLRYGTGEFVEPIPSTVSVSNIVDPIKGLIQDPTTGEIRKATSGEMLTSALFERQRKPTKLTTAEAREKFETQREDLRQKLIKQRKDRIKKERASRLGMGGAAAFRGKTPEEIRAFINAEPELSESDLSAIESQLNIYEPQEDRVVRKEPDSPAVVVETPLEYGLRLVNTLSAVAEPALEVLQESYRQGPINKAISYIMTGDTEPPKAKTRKGAGYKETEIEGFGGQVLTNMLTGQGVFDRTQAQMLPPDEKASGLDYFMTQGTLPTMAMSLATEIPIPVTPLGIPGIGKVIKFPLRALQSAGARAEIDLALRSSKTGQTAKDIQTQIKSQGGTPDTPTLRKKAAEIIGDQYGTHESVRQIIKGKGPRERISIDDFENKSNPYVREIFKDASEVDVEDVQKVFTKMDDVFSGLVGGAKNEKIILRRVKRVAEDTRNKILTGKKPVRDADIIERAVSKSKMEDLTFWNKAREDIIPFELKKTFDDAYKILETQRFRQLTPDEIIKLGRNYDLLEQAGIFSANNIKVQPKHIYSSVRNAVSDVMRDNFLKNVPDDMIYVGQNVAVPYKKIIHPVKGKTPLMEKFNQQVRPYFENDNGILKSFAAQKILRLQSRKGFQLPSSLQQKLTNLANGSEVRLSYPELQYLENTVLEEFALDILDGVRIKTGTLTGQLAEVPAGALRQTLIKTGKVPTTSVIQVKSIANSIRLLLTKGGDYSRSTGKITKWLTGIDDLPAPMQQLNTSVMRTHNAATDKVATLLQPPLGAEPRQHFDSVWNQYQQSAMDINLQRIEGNIRARDELAIDSADIEKQTKKSEKIATSRKVLQLSEIYGRDNVTEFLAKELGVSAEKIKYKDLIEQVDFIEQNMKTSVRQIYQAKTWKKMIQDFFVSPKDVESLNPRWVDNIYDLIRIDKNQPYWIDGNIKPLNIDTYKQVVEELRELDPSLKNYGLKTPYKRDEVFVLPFIKNMIETQRTLDMKVEIDNFITKSPDIFIKLDRTIDSTLGLESTKQLADQITNQLQNTFSFAKKKGLADDEMIDLFTHQIRESLFDGWAADIWSNSDREVQSSFIEKYMKKMIDAGTPILNDMDDFVVDLYNNNILKSDAFAELEKKSRKVLEEISSKFAEEGMTKEQSKVFDMLEKTLFAEEGLIATMRGQYLNNLTLRSDGVMDGLFTQQIQSINDYFARYGLNNETMVENLRSMAPRLKYLGDRNIGVIYGDMHQVAIEKLLKIVDNKNTKRFISELETRFATATNSQADYIKFYFGSDVLNVTRRWSIARMLGGVAEPSTKFFGMNRMTAPYLFFASLGSGTMKASTVAKFTTLAGTMGVLPVVTGALRKLGYKSFTGFVDSNRVMLAPADEVFIRQSDGAIRDITAGEIRQSMLNEGVLYSRSDADFLDTQFNRLLIDAGLTVDGLARYHGHPLKLARKIYDNLSPSGKNLWAEFAKLQDTEMRRYVFMQSLKDGESISQAAEKARRSMLDYGSLTDFEKKSFFRQIYFYSFMRTMGAETINALYRGVVSDNFNPAIGLIKAQSRLNKDTEERAMSMQQQSRIYNIFTKTSEGMDYYVSGPVNPSISMFDLMSRATLLIGGGIQSITKEEQDFEMDLLDAFAATLTAAGSSAGETYVRGNPIANIFFESLRAKMEERPIPFPSELMYAAEENDNMLEVIKLYSLEQRDPTAGRPVTRFPVRDKTTGEVIHKAGTYFDFPKTSPGLREGYNLYLWHRLLGLTAFAEVVSRTGIAPAALTRFHKDTLRASMASAKDPRMEGREGEVRIPMESVYLKSLNQQELDMRSDVVYGLYMLGLATPVKATKRDVVMERLLRNTLNEIKETEKLLNE